MMVKNFETKIYIYQGYNYNLQFILEIKFDSPEKWGKLRNISSKLKFNLYNF